MYTYLIINLFIIIFPLILSFDKRVNFYQKTGRYLLSILMVSTFFIIWDNIAVARNDWSFNQKYITGLKLINLPLEEILFFITVPYSCLFLYEAVCFYVKEKTLNLQTPLFLIVIICFITSLLSLNKYYTFTVSAVSVITSLSGMIFFRKILYSLRYLIFISLSFLLFFIFNLILTSLPVVIYNPKAITNIRIVTIPIEDFVYNYTLLTLYLIFYKLGNKIFKSLQ